jgi:dipeptidyl aminopeptidase/acylaminoacyl peptidase
VVPFGQSEALARRLEAVGAPYRLHVFEAASHYLPSEDGDALAIYDLTLELLREQLGG